MEFSDLWLNFIFLDLRIWVYENVNLAVPILEQIMRSVFNYGLGYLKGMIKICLLYESCRY